MQNGLLLSGHEITYTLKQSPRARRLRLSVRRGGYLVATAPTYLSIKAVEEFISKKSTWVLRSIEHQSKFDPDVKLTKADFIKHREVARKLVNEKIYKLNSIYGFKIGRISIRNQKTRWGSCSSKGNLNFNYKIAFLPDRQAEYIVAHELSHLGELNHSHRFWALVEKTIPDYMHIRRELEKSGIRPS
jgi:hypothetical protein